MNLPDDLKTCHSMIEELVAAHEQFTGALRQRDRRISQLEHRLDSLLRARTATCMECGCLLPLSYLSIDNNAAERLLRPVVVGRKNRLFVGSPQGGHMAVILFSIVMTCKRHNIHPFRYIREVLTRLPDHPMPHLEDLLPDRIYTQEPDQTPIPSS